MTRKLVKLGWGIILFIPLVLNSQEVTEKPGYREIFGDDYESAWQTIQEHEWWSDSLKNHGIDPDFALAVIFPELIRYSSISDYIEVKALEVLYVQYGCDYADFSIGLFQMKPSFAERIEADLLRYRLADSFPSLLSLESDTINDLQVRKARILRLKDETGQLLYLEAFLRIMDHLCTDVAFESETDRLGVYAQGYNEGYWRGDKVIRGYGDQAGRWSGDHVVRWAGGQGYFYVGMIEPEKKYSYAEIAVDYYRSTE